MMSEFQNNPWTTHRELKTICLFASFFSMGLSMSVIGPTIVSMEVLLDTDTRSISATFTGGSLGYLVGSIVCGVIYTNLNKELLFSASLLFIGTALASMSFSPNLLVFIGIHFIQCFFTAMIDTGGQSYLLKVWEAHKYRQPLMQCTHLLWSVGSTLGPLLVQPFLVDLPEDGIESTLNVTSRNTSLQNGLSSAPHNTSCNTNYTETMGDVTLVRFAYIVIAALVFISSILFFTVFITMGPSFLECSRQNKGGNKHNEDMTNKDNKLKTSKTFTVRLLLLMCLFYFFYLWVEIIPGSLMAVFVIKGLGWHNEQGALITSVYWGTHGIGRLIGIPLAFIMSPKHMLIMDCLVLSSGFCLLLLVNIHASVMWIGACVFGLGMGTIFASGILWVEGYIEITGAASSILLAAASVGGMTGPVLTALLMEQFTCMCFVYVLIATSSILTALYVGAVTYAERTGTKRDKRKLSFDAQTADVEQELKHINSIIEGSEQL